MATNENQIGVTAVFDLTEFNKNQQKYNALIAQANDVTSKFYKQRTADMNQAWASLQQLRDKTIDAYKRMEEAPKEAAKSHSKSLKQMVSDVKTQLFGITVAVAATIAAYKQLESQARELGDTESIAGFDAMNEAVTNLSDTWSALILESVPVGDALKFIADGVTALTQVIVLSAGAVKWFTTLLSGIAIWNKDFQNAIKSGGLEQYLTDLNARANQAANDVIVAGATAPERVKQTAADKEAEKQLDKDKEAYEKLVKQRQDYTDKIRDLQIKSGEDILAAEADLHEKQASAWADYMSKSADIIGEGIKKRAELLTTYQDAIRSAEREYQKATEDAAYNHGQKLADIERTYQETIRNIERDYKEESLDAARNLDAIGFVRAKQKRDQGLDDAKRTRDISNDSENENYNRQLAELQRSLEDKKREAEQAYRRGLDDQRRAEQEAQQSAKDSYNQQMGDAQTAFNNRLAAIQAAYNNEDAAAQAHYLNQEALLQAHLARMQALMATYGIGGRPTTTPRRFGGEQMAEGGARVVSSPTQFTAGEAGPELAMFVPLNRSVPVAAAPQVVNHTGDFTHQIDSTIRSSVAGIDGRITAAVTKVLREVLG